MSLPLCYIVESCPRILVKQSTLLVLYSLDRTHLTPHTSHLTPHTSHLTVIHCGWSDLLFSPVPVLVAACAGLVTVLVVIIPVDRETFDLLRDQLSWAVLLPRPGHSLMSLKEKFLE